MYKVLVVDDEQQVRHVISYGLMKAGYDVVEASNGIEALTLVRKEAIDAAIIDIIMPEKEGIETIIEIREITEKLPIIAISGGGRTRKTHFLEVSRKFGADSVMIKPFTPSELVMELESLLQRE